MCYTVPSALEIYYGTQVQGYDRHTSYAISTSRSVQLFAIDVKKRFYVVLFWSSFLKVFNVVFIFQTFFIFKKTLAKFRVASEWTRSTFKITATKFSWFINNRILCSVIRMQETMNSTILLAWNDDSFCKTKLNDIFWVALKAISWASGVELNYTKKRFFLFLSRFSRFNVFYFYLNVFLHLCFL